MSAVGGDIGEVFTLYLSVFGDSFFDPQGIGKRDFGVDLSVVSILGYRDLGMDGDTCFIADRGIEDLGIG